MLPDGVWHNVNLCEMDGECVNQLAQHVRTSNPGVNVVFAVLHKGLGVNMNKRSIWETDATYAIITNLF